jgi:hypothetical protein
MSFAHAGGIAAAEKEARLPMKDWILLPAIAMLATILLAASAELTARWLFPVSQTDLKNCYVKDDPSGDAPAKPGSVCTERMAESPLPVEYRYDSHGHRADGELEPKRPDTLRIVLLGSSMAFGLYIPKEMSFAALLPVELSHQTGHKIELYNEATGGKFRGGPFPVQSSASHFKEVISAAPDLILWIITPKDIENASSIEPPLPQIASQAHSTPGTWSSHLLDEWDSLGVVRASSAFMRRLRYRWEQTRISFALKYLLVKGDTEDQYLTSYLKNEKDAGFLKAKPNSDWQHWIQNFQIDAEDFEKQADAANVPLVAVLVPDRAQAIMISMGKWPEGYDPYKLDNELRAIIVSHGGTYIDILSDFRTIPNSEQDYFPLDGHPNPAGHAIISKLLTKELTSSPFPALRVSAQARTASARKK